MSKASKEETVVEWCSNCEREVRIAAEPYIEQKCPHCGAPIRACSMCDTDIVNCSVCERKYCHDLRKGFDAVMDRRGWKVSDDSHDEELPDGCIELELEWSSPAGEDFIFTETADTLMQIILYIESYADEFDEDEHIKETMKEPGAPSIMELAEDAKAIHGELKALAEDLRKMVAPCAKED
jgi:hypothetical protein